MTVTIWNTLANDGAGAIATRRAIVSWTDPEGDAAPEPIWGDPVPLVRIAPGETVFGKKWASWARPGRAAEDRADPASHGMDNFLPGERILDDVIAPFTPSGPDKAKGDLGATPVVDLEKGEAIWSYGEVTVALADRKAEMLAAVKETAAGRIAAGFAYTVPGGEAHTYQIDDTSQAHMLAVFADILDGATEPHGGYWRSAANVNVAMTKAQNKAFLKAAKAYKMAIIRTAQALVDAIVAAADHDALDLIDVAAGTVDGDGGWPSGG